MVSMTQNISEEYIWSQNMGKIKDREDHVMRNFVIHLTLPVLVEQNMRCLLSLSQTDALGETGASYINAFKTGNLGWE
jgi:hypothetical protein